MMIVHLAYALMEELVMTELIATRVHVFKDSMDLTVLRVRLSYSRAIVNIYIYIYIYINYYSNNTYYIIMKYIYLYLKL